MNFFLLIFSLVYPSSRAILSDNRDLLNRWNSPYSCYLKPVLCEEFCTNPQVQQGPMSAVIYLSSPTNMSKHMRLPTVLGALLFLGMVNIAFVCWLLSVEAFTCAILCSYKEALMNACKPHLLAYALLMYFALLMPLNTRMHACKLHHFVHPEGPSGTLHFSYDSTHACVHVNCTFLVHAEGSSCS